MQYQPLAKQLSVTVKRDPGACSVGGHHDHDIINDINSGTWNASPVKNYKVGLTDQPKPWPGEGCGWDTGSSEAVSTAEKHTTYKLQVMFYSGSSLRTIAQETASQVVLRNYSEEVREEPRSKRVVLKSKHNMQITANHTHTHTHKSQVNDFSAFLWEDTRFWAHEIIPQICILTI